VCGIAGLLDPTGAAVDRALVRAMSQAVASRGPDGEGTFFAPGVGLGHRRLAVLDPSPAGAQPMGSEDGLVQVVFNGEIYNFADLRAELRADGHAFRSRCDTEVLLRGYEAWGDAVVDKIDGMFAFGLWDGRARRFLAARDRMGKKPFYYAQVPRPGAPPLFAFGSELKALRPVPGLDRRLDPEALARYLAFEHVPAPRTIVVGARKLEPGCRLVLDLGRDPDAQPVVDRYWDLPFPAAHGPVEPAEAVELLRELLHRAVERRLVADVPLGIFLSGGLDSSSIAATAARIAGADRLRTFSVGFSDPSFDESAHARAVARHLGTDHHEERIDAARLLALLPEVEGILDEPLADASIVPTYLLARFARQQVTVALGGDGGDELFGGYPTFRAEPAARLFFGLPAPVRRLATRAAGRLPARTDYFSLDFKVHQFLRGAPAPDAPGGNGPDGGPRRHQRWLASFVPEELGALLTRDLHAAIGGDPLCDVDARARTGPARTPGDRLMDFYARFYLAGDVLTKVDRAAGAVGLEVRAPLLDTALVGFACALPPGLRQGPLVPKRLLKDAMRGRLPPAIVGRRKQGFGVPVAAWLRGALAPALRDELAPDKIRREGIFDPGAVGALVDDHLTGRRDRRKQLWTLFVFQRWAARWGGGV
jgi:asparagine synthase (glutamine-hydrolysing)